MGCLRRSGEYATASGAPLKPPTAASTPDATLQQSTAATGFGAPHQGGQAAPAPPPLRYEWYTPTPHRAAAAAQQRPPHWHWRYPPTAHHRSPPTPDPRPGRPADPAPPQTPPPPHEHRYGLLPHADATTPHPNPAAAGRADQTRSNHRPHRADRLAPHRPTPTQPQPPGWPAPRIPAHVPGPPHQATMSSCRCPDRPQPPTPRAHQSEHSKTRRRPAHQPADLPPAPPSRRASPFSRDRLHSIASAPRTHADMGRQSRRSGHRYGNCRVASKQRISPECAAM